MKNKTRYFVQRWEWVKEKGVYEPFIDEYETIAQAKERYENIEISEDIPQVSIKIDDGESREIAFIKDMCTEDADE